MSRLLCVGVTAPAAATVEDMSGQLENYACKKTTLYGGWECYVVATTWSL